MELNMDFLTEMMMPSIVAICICVGFIIKSWKKKIPTKYIPTIVAVLGIFLAIWLNGWKIDPDTILTGLLSGLASCGLYDTYKHMFKPKKKNNTEE